MFNLAKTAHKSSETVIMYTDPEEFGRIDVSRKRGIFACIYKTELQDYVMLSKRIAQTCEK